MDGAMMTNKVHTNSLFLLLLLTLELVHLFTLSKLGIRLRRRSFTKVQVIIRSIVSEFRLARELQGRFY